MSPPADKNQLMENIRTAHTRLYRELETIPQELTREKSMDNNHSPCDLVAYQIGWGRLLLSWEQREQQGLPTEMPAPGYKWNQLGLLADSFYKAHASQPLEQLLANFQALVRELEAFIGNCSHNTLFEIGQRHWAGPRWPLVKWIQVNTIAPYNSARTRLRRWKKSHPAFQNADSASQQGR